MRPWVRLSKGNSGRLIDGGSSSIAFVSPAWLKQVGREPDR